MSDIERVERVVYKLERELSRAMDKIELARKLLRDNEAQKALDVLEGRK